jgi:hypothetical protein
MRFFRALFYPFEDRHWPSKLMLTMVLAAIPVAGFFLIKGWEFEISVRVRHGHRDLLPPWNNVMGTFMRGLKIRIAGIIYNIPSYIMIGVVVFLWAELIVRMFNQPSLPIKEFFQLYKEGIGLRVALIGVTLVMMLLANTLYWSGYLRYIETRRFIMFFDIPENMRLAFNNFIDDLVVGIYLGIVSLCIVGVDSLLSGALAATGVGIILASILVPALTLTVMSWFSGHLFGQLAIRTLDRPPGKSAKQVRRWRG